MTITSSLNAGVSGLNANASRLATISDNIANSATAGYKRSTVDFHSMVVGTGGAGVYTAGGVRSAAVRLIDQPGALTGTDNATDLAIDGRGFMPVTRRDAIGDDATVRSMALMTTGSFRLDADGWLKTTAGQVLMGWPAGADGDIPAYPRDSLSGLAPIRIDTARPALNPTTAASLSVNLPATATRAGEAGTPYEMSMEYYTPLGAAEQLSFKFAPVVPVTGASNEWMFTIEDSASGGVVGEYRLRFDDTPARAGTLADVVPVSGAAHDPTTGRIELALPGGPVSLDIGRIGAPGGCPSWRRPLFPRRRSRTARPPVALSGWRLMPRAICWGFMIRGSAGFFIGFRSWTCPIPTGCGHWVNRLIRCRRHQGISSCGTRVAGPSAPLSALRAKKALPMSRMN